MVFHCSARYKGTSLNEQLHQGPDWTNSLVSVLTRFRQELVTLVADVEAMFHQVPDESTGSRCAESSVVAWWWLVEGACRILRESSTFWRHVLCQLYKLCLSKTITNGTGNKEEVVNTVKRISIWRSCFGRAGQGNIRQLSMKGKMAEA